MRGIGETAIGDIAARDALMRLVLTYSRAIDRRDFTQLRSLYADTAEDHHGHAFQGGPDAYVDFVRTALSAYVLTAHYVTQALFEIEGARAQGEVYKINYHRKHDGSEIVTGSRSHDHYLRKNGRWLFASRSVTLDWARQGPTDAVAFADPAANAPPGRAGAEDPSYLLLSLFPRASR